MNREHISLIGAIIITITLAKVLLMLPTWVLATIVVGVLISALRSKGRLNHYINKENQRRLQEKFESVKNRVHSTRIIDI